MMGFRTGKRGPRVEYRCSFCGNRHDEVRRVIAGPGGVYICDECIDLCQEILDEKRASPPNAPSTAQQTHK